MIASLTRSIASALAAFLVATTLLTATVADPASAATTHELAADATHFPLA